MNPGEVQPHVLELGAPVGEDLDGLVDGRHKEAPAQQVQQGMGLPLAQQQEQAGGQASQAEKLCKVGELSQDVPQLFPVGEQVFDKRGKQGQHVEAQGAESVLLSMEFPQIKHRLHPSSTDRMRTPAFLPFVTAVPPCSVFLHYTTFSGKMKGNFIPTDGF